ncbi:hypothetical protein OG497_38140 [Streptomyces sp. NBC_01242]|uniref:hypothetical protein n=1 Tax=Streptomyces sp. NBC_01242 TaxID=2903795 RepID=UPI002254C5E0|nr:hypothetical protein [Streptomyces sp. NBC_01242]MCX4799681.1 hypothetical protein [Streptomyces sp. NBC_01242]
MTQLTIPAVESLVTRKGWTPPLAPGDFAYGTVQAFDQALANTGMAIVKSNESGIHLLVTAILRPPSDVQEIKSHEGNFARADSLYGAVCRNRTGFAATAVDAVVYERPPVTGMRTESITLAGREIHRATHGQAIFVDNRHAKTVIVGTAGSSKNKVTKAHVKEAVERYVVPPSGQGKAMPWNEHVRDAVLLALAWLYDEKRRQAMETSA